MIIHMSTKSYDSLCGTKGSFTSTRHKKSVTCGRCLVKLGLEKENKPNIKESLFIPREPSRTGQNI